MPSHGFLNQTLDRGNIYTYSTLFKAFAASSPIPYLSIFQDRQIQQLIVLHNLGSTNSKRLLLGCDLTSFLMDQRLFDTKTDLLILQGISNYLDGFFSVCNSLICTCWEFGLNLPLWIILFTYQKKKKKECTSMIVSLRYLCVFIFLSTLISTL